MDNAPAVDRAPAEAVQPEEPAAPPHSEEPEVNEVDPPPKSFPSPVLPDIPSGDLTIDLGLTSLENSQPDMATASPDYAKLHRRASNVLKLSEENNKLKEELAAMTARIEAAERRRTELRARSQQVMEAPSS